MESKKEHFFHHFSACILNQASDFFFALHFGYEVAYLYLYRFRFTYFSPVFFVYYCVQSMVAFLAFFSHAL